jgi:hypothetical protein
MSHPVGILGVMTSYPTVTWQTVRGRGHRVTRPTVAAERSGGYEAVASAAGGAAGGVTVDGDGGGVGGGGVPFGLPVLAGLPELAGVLEAVAGAEQRMVDAVVGLARLLASDEVARATGVPVEQWLGIVCRLTRMDRRLLLRLARLLGRFPALAAGVGSGRVSFAQLRGLGMVLRQAPTVIDGELDVLLVRLLAELEGADPDVLVDQVRQAIVELLPPVSVEESETVTNALYLQPNLSRTGGRFAGEYDAAGMAILDTATAPSRDQLAHPNGTRGARADNLLARLTHTGTGTPAAPVRAGGSAQQGDTATGQTGDTTTGDTATGEPDDSDDADADAADAAGVGGAGVSGVPRWRVQAGGLLPPVKLLARVQLETLGVLPADLLTQLTGGHLKLSSQAARYLLDERGVELRLVVIDQGEVVGVGRQTRQPPGWLRDIALAVHDTCTEPLCERPARSAHLDHATPWWPNRPDSPYGTTDTDNLGPLCPTTNQTKETSGWHAVQSGDGRRTWTHQPTGLAITTVPATWRPAGWTPPCHHPQPHTPQRPARDGGPGPPSGAPPDPGGTAPPHGSTHPDPREAAYENLRQARGLPPIPTVPPPDPDDLPF